MWKAHIIETDAEGKITDWEAVNADPTSTWQKARDLVSYTKLQDLKNIKTNAPIITCAAEFFKYVSIKKSSRTWDCRDTSIQCAMIEQEGASKKKQKEFDPNKALSKVDVDGQIDCIDFLGFMPLVKWTSQQLNAEPVFSPMALAAIEAITSGAAIEDGFDERAPTAAAASSSSAAAATTDMDDD